MLESVSSSQSQTYTEMYCICRAEMDRVRETAAMQIAAHMYPRRFVTMHGAGNTLL